MAITVTGPTLYNPRPTAVSAAGDLYTCVSNQDIEIESFSSNASDLAAEILPPVKPKFPPSPATPNRPGTGTLAGGNWSFKWDQPHPTNTAPTYQRIRIYETIPGGDSVSYQLHIPARYAHPAVAHVVMATATSAIQVPYWPEPPQFVEPKHHVLLNQRYFDVLAISTPFTGRRGGGAYVRSPMTLHATGFYGVLQNNGEFHANSKVLPASYTFSYDHFNNHWSFVFMFDRGAAPDNVPGSRHLLIQVSSDEEFEMGGTKQRVYANRYFELA